MLGKKEKLSFKEIWNAIKALPEDERGKLKKKFEQEFADKNLQDEKNVTQEEAANLEQNDEDVSLQDELQAEPDEEETDKGKNIDSGALVEMITKTEARVAALEKSLQFIIDEELGTDSDFADEVNTQMPTSYARQAKEIRF